MKRRTFISSSAKACFVAPLILNNPFSLFASSSASQIVSVVDHLATTLKMSPGHNPNGDGVIVEQILSYAVNRTRVSNMVDTAVMKLTGKSSVGKAWESLFPAGHPNKDTTVAIKINLSYGEGEEFNDWSKTPCPYGPKAALSDAIILGLTQMLEGTFPVENIVMFDIAYSYKLRSQFPLIQGYRPVAKNESGISIDNSPGTYRIHWVAPRHPFEIPYNAPKFVAAPDFPDPYKAPQRILPPAYQNDFMINVAIAKTHREGGITGVMKNTYGCTDNPVGTHGAGDDWKYDGSPYPGSRLGAPAFYKAIDQQSPTILNVLDALSGVYYGGPLSGKVFQENMITVSRDPVATDATVLHLVNKHRRKNGYASLTTDEGRGKDGFPNASVLQVASEIFGLGSMSLDRTYTYDLAQNKEAYQIPVLQKSQSRVSDVRKKRKKYQLDVFLDDSRRTHQIDSRITDVEGNVFKSFTSNSTRKSHFSLQWDHRSDNKETMGKGLYVWQVTVDGMQHTRVINDL